MIPVSLLPFFLGNFYIFSKSADVRKFLLYIFVSGDMKFYISFDKNSTMSILYLAILELF